MWPRAFLALAVGVLIGAVGAATLLSSIPGGARSAVPAVSLPPVVARTFDGDFFAPTWSCVGQWVLDKAALEWVCIDDAFNVYERAFSPQLATKVALARDGTWPCTDYPGFEYSAMLGGCKLPEAELYRIRH